MNQCNNKSICQINQGLNGGQKMSKQFMFKGG